MSIIPILVVVALVIFVMYLLLSKNAAQPVREGIVKDVLKKDALAVDFGDGKSVVVKLFGIVPASDGEMLDEKIFAFLEENVRGQRVKIVVRESGTSDLLVGELYSMADEYVNAALVRHGFARWSPSEAGEDTALAKAQELATSEQLGVWNPAIRQLVADRISSNVDENLTDDDVANMSVNPEEMQSKAD